MKELKSGFVKANNKVLREIIKECGASEAATYLIILSHRNTNDDKCFPSIRTLENELNVSERSINRRLEKLKNKGFIEVETGKEGQSNRYYFPKESFYEKWGE